MARRLLPQSYRRISIGAFSRPVLLGENALPFFYRAGSVDQDITTFVRPGVVSPRRRFLKNWEHGARRRDEFCSRWSSHEHG